MPESMLTAYHTSATPENWPGVWKSYSSYSVLGATTFTVRSRLDILATMKKHVGGGRLRCLHMPVYPVDNRLSVSAVCPYPIVVLTNSWLQLLIDGYLLLSKGYQIFCHYNNHLLVRVNKQEDEKRLDGLYRIMKWKYCKRYVRARTDHQHWWGCCLQKR